MGTLPQMGLRDSPHQCLDVLGFAHPQTQVDCQRLSTQTVQRHRLTNRLHDRPQILNAHIYTQLDFKQLKTEKCILKPPMLQQQKLYSKSEFSNCGAIGPRPILLKVYVLTLPCFCINWLCSENKVDESFTFHLQGDSRYIY